MTARCSSSAADGYTGWALTCHLLARGTDVVGVDRFLRRTEAAPSVTPIAAHDVRAAATERFGGSYTFHELDIADYDALERCSRRRRPRAS
jgi:NAD dependent epimerase/dehydratase family.